MAAISWKDREHCSTTTKPIAKVFYELWMGEGLHKRGPMLRGCIEVIPSGEALDLYGDRKYDKGLALRLEDGREVCIQIGSHTPLNTYRISIRPEVDVDALLSGD